jgi:predicted ATPase
MLIDAAIKWAEVEDRECYPFCLNAIAMTERLDLRASVTIFVGENGAGKSTFLEALAMALGCNAEGGSRNFRFSTMDTHTSLHDYLRIAKDSKPIRDVFFYRAETYYNFASEMKKLDAEPSFDPEIKHAYGGKELHQLSHGQSVIQLFRHRFRSNGVYIMDEPEAALSPGRQLEVIVHVQRLAAAGAQFIIATHSPILMAIPGAKIYEVRDDGLSEADYDSLDQVAIYKRMLNDRKRFVQSLIADETSSSSQSS